MIYVSGLYLQFVRVKRKVLLTFAFALAAAALAFFFFWSWVFEAVSRVSWKETMNIYRGARAVGG